MDHAPDDLEGQVDLLKAETEAIKASLYRYEEMLTAIRSNTIGNKDSFAIQVAPALKWTAGIIATLMCALLISTVQLAWSNQERLVTVETNQHNVMVWFVDCVYNWICRDRRRNFVISTATTYPV